MIAFIFWHICLQQEKKRLIEKEKEDDKLKQKASISIPLVDEQSEDIETAKTTCFSASSSGDVRKRKRMEIQSQSLFKDSSSSPSSAKVKQARLTLLKACGLSSKRTDDSRTKRTVKGIRNTLGIETGKITK